MKLSTYTLKKSDKELIGLLNKDSLINLNVFFGEICLVRTYTITRLERTNN